MITRCVLSADKDSSNKHPPGERKRSSALTRTATLENRHRPKAHPLWGVVELAITAIGYNYYNHRFQNALTQTLEKIFD
jgi:hypothetical protein